MKINLDLAGHIRDLTIKALASDDRLVEDLVLKGGNAITVLRKAEGKLPRASYDLDYSIAPGDFDDPDDISNRIEATLKQTFIEHGFVLTDYKFKARPQIANEQTDDFWGGYTASFKVIHADQFEKYVGDKEALIRNSIPLQPNSSPTFELDFSKHEEVSHKVIETFDDFAIQVYTPLMIIYEKLRAICQQLEDYGKIIPSHSPRSRARDFYDIHLLITEVLGKIDLNSEDNRKLMAAIFEAKRVPVEFIYQIPKSYELHKASWGQVDATVSAKENLETYDFYFDFVLDAFKIK